MHFTPEPRWLRIVSIAIVVLPVLRSPMINSRCPRPIGTMPSTALIPVCSGSCTGLRPTIPGAWTSRRRVLSVPRGPLPSIGWANAFTTRPRRASPTGTARMRPVARTALPSSTPSARPSTTAPMASSSRLRARPRRPPSNSRSSLTAVLGRPATRATPSPTLSTCPTCSAARVGENESTCLRSAAAISAALIVSSAMSDLLLELLEPVTDGPVNNSVADAGH